MIDQVLIEHSKQINDAVAAWIEVQGMIAHNERCKFFGIEPEYGEQAFKDVAEGYGLHYNGNVEKSRKFY